MFFFQVHLSHELCEISIDMSIVSLFDEWGML